MVLLERGTRERKPLTWLPLKAGPRWTAEIICANGHGGGLTNHTISSDGSVSPSCLCPVEGCGWHEMVRLTGWRPT